MAKKLYIYKGFSLDELKKIRYPALVDTKIEDKISIINLNDDYKRELMGKLMTFNGEYYITYEEFVLIQELGEEIIRLSQAELIIFRNAIFPEYYPYIEISTEESKILDLAYQYLNTVSEEDEVSDSIVQALRFIGDIKLIDGKYFMSYKNPEMTIQSITTINYLEEDYKREIESINSTPSYTSEYVFEITSEIESYLRLISLLRSKDIKTIGIKINDRIYFDKYLQHNFKALINKYYDTNFYFIKDKVDAKTYREEFDTYLKDLWGYEEFKRIKVYNNPDESKEVIEVTQGQIIEDIVAQSEKASNNENYKDIFITAPTGAGKSVIFQIAALYIAKNYKKVTIIISPLIALMKDQVKNLYKNGIYNAAYINSELNFLEKEEIIGKIKSNEIDILYLAPETLLSYSIDNFIGERKIGLFIVDEAHIVTTWGKGFRPDYWYLGKYLSRIRSELQSFPIVTFTATAVYGGNDDMYDETIESLNMKSTIKYLGNIKRRDISFDVDVNLDRTSKEEYEQRKIEKMQKRFNGYIKSNKKTIAYFPYASTALNTSEDKQVEDISDKIAVYTSKINKNMKNLSVEEFISGKRKIMFATKAFGMGIDINDIEVVYHYAPTGNLNDYVQEIGRAARRKDLQGIACIDFMDKDFSFVNALFGMSTIKQYQVKAVLKKIYNIYKRREKQNFLVTPNDFSFVFSKESKNNPEELERKLKTVLLMIEKDLEQQFRFPVLISRPKSMFSKAYVVLDNTIEEELINSKYGKYFSRLQNGRVHEKEGACIVSDFGDVYLMNLRELWEDHYPEISFASFKYMLFNKSEEFQFKYKNHIHLRYRISINATNDNRICDLKELLMKEIDNINGILDNFKDQGKMFSIQEFSSEINKIYNNKEKSFAIASSYIDLISPTLDQGRFMQRPIEFNQQFNKYRIVNRTYNNAKREYIIKSDIMRKLTSNDNSMCIYYPKSNKKDFDLFRVLYLLEIFGLCNYEILGGESPEVFIRLNDPLKIKRITSDGYEYKNEILSAVRTRHENSTKILRKFFTELNDDIERWDFIEDYFLGHDVLTDIE